jgi:AraC-like DNA-binding protein
MSVLKDVEPYLPALRARETTLREVAEAIDCSPSYLCRLLSGTLKRVQSSTKTRQKRKELVGIRRQMRRKHAISVLSGEKSLKRAAADARCSERTMRRYVALERATWP